MIVKIGSREYRALRIGNSHAFVRNDCVEVIKHIFNKTVQDFDDLEIMLNTLKRLHRKTFYLVDNICIDSRTYEQMKQHLDKPLNEEELNAVQNVNTLHQEVDTHIIPKSIFKQMEEAAFAIINFERKRRNVPFFISVPVRAI
tara:strand:+ start:381 stop:809 length:429 start_codon:yes stop_codon:yes gene_type:complete